MHAGNDEDRFFCIWFVHGFNLWYGAKGWRSLFNSVLDGRAIGMVPILSVSSRFDRLELKLGRGPRWETVGCRVTFDSFNVEMTDINVTFDSFKVEK
ncbi:MAG: hypothetical protein F6K35_48780 [Okeania sp. SIO2H7]|nr:hypothetical protein [Okeania sp. SIO2H7]